MGVLKDTCVFISNTETSERIFEFSKDCSSINKELIISDEILRELKPGKALAKSIKVQAENRYSAVQGAIGLNIIKLFDIKSSDQAYRNYTKIRKNFYSWMKNPKYLKRLISSGLLKREVISSPNFEYKDAGECSLVAIAMTNKDKYLIVSNDKGEVFAHPETNIYDNKIASGIQVMNFYEWEKYIKKQKEN